MMQNLLNITIYTQHCSFFFILFNLDFFSGTQLMTCYVGRVLSLLNAFFFKD